MILSRLIVQWLEWIIEIGLWLSLIGAFVMGVGIGDGFFGSLISGILAVVFSGVACAILFGFFIVLNDIRRMLQEALNTDSNKTAEQ